MNENIVIYRLATVGEKYRGKDVTNQKLRVNDVFATVYTKEKR